MHEDIALPVCDACVDDSRTQERANDAMRAVPLDVEPDEVVSGLLFIGAKESAANSATLARLGISRVLICCDSLRAYHEPSESLRYHRLPIADSLAQDLGRYVPTALAFIAQGALKGQRTLVHCNAGVSRSGSIVVEWLRRTAALSLLDAWAAARGVARASRRTQIFSVSCRATVDMMARNRRLRPSQRSWQLKVIRPVTLPLARRS